MIPHTLELKNFLSYGSNCEKINFGQHQLICLSGKNGNGKSALLDAMTWTLWGQARKVAGATKPDEGLLKLGQADMRVLFEFECNGQRYRVCREFTTSYGRNQVTLDFEVYSPESSTYASLTDSTVRSTQAKIISTLGLDFETFVNTAFLRQGQSNEFSCKNPKERKQILASILGLARYDSLKASALERAKKCNNEKSVLNAVDEQAIRELEREGELVEQEKKLTQTIHEHATKIKKCTTELEASEKKHNALAEKKNKHKLMCDDIFAKQKDKKQLVQQLEKSVAEWRVFHRKQLAWSGRDDIEKEKQKLLETERTFRQTHSASLEVHEKLLKARSEVASTLEKYRAVYDKKIQKCKDELDSAYGDHKQHCFIAEQNTKQLAELEVQIKKMYHEIDELEAHTKKHSDLEKKIEKHSAQFEKRRSFYQVLVSKGNWIATQLRECESKKHILHDRDNPACPTCDQMLTTRRKMFLATKFEKNESLYRHQLTRIRSVLEKLKAVLQKQHQEAGDYAKLEQECNKNTAAHAALIKRRDECQREHDGRSKQKELFEKQRLEHEKKIEQSKKVYEKQTASRDKDLQGEPTVVMLASIVKDLEKKSASITYDKKKHKEILTSLEACEKKVNEFEAIKKEFAAQDGRKERVHSHVVALKKLKKTISDLEAQSEKHKVSDKEYREIIETMSRIKKEQAALVKDKEELVKALGSVASDIKRLEQYKKESQQRKTFMAALTTEMSEYQTLASIFGKDGIQALLIEEAIPEIEDEANKLLARLTDNNAQVMIESLRDLKKGGAKETLEIKISDAFGIRPYELFSGGEAFRIDFALRIAISRLLARRAGMALQTLIIDEGFGSQDEEGLSRLMDALYVLRDDFARVIVVSHLPVFKDNFPVHLVVEKGPSGSYVSTVERG